MPSFASKSRTSNRSRGWLAVERRNELAGVEVGEADDLDFSETELIFDGSRDGPGFRLIDAAAQDRRHFDLDPDPIHFHEYLADDVLRDEFYGRHPRPTKALANAVFQPLHRSVDVCEGRRPVLHRQVREIDI